MHRKSVALVATLPLLLAGCFGGSSSSDSEAGGDVEEGSAAPDSFTGASWATPVEPQGEWVTSLANDDVRVDVYFIGIEAAPEESSWQGSGDEALFGAGDDVLVLQYVLTNVSDADIDVSNGDGRPGLNYEGNDYINVPQESRQNALLESAGVPTSTLDFEQFDPANGHVQVLGTGESVSAGAVFWHPEGEELTFSYELPKLTADGEFDHGNYYIDGEVDLPIDV